MNRDKWLISKRPDGVAVSRRRFLQVVGYGLVAIGIAACNTRPDYFSISITDQGTYEPSLLVVPNGAVVVWLNQNSVPYSVTCDPSKATDKARVSLPTNASAFDSGILYSGDKWQYTFNTPGDFRYTSVLGNAESAIGVIRVTA